MPRRHGQPAHCRNVPRKRQTQLARRQIPNLDGSVPRARGKPLVVRLHGQRPHPAEMPADDALQLPRRMPVRPRLCQEAVWSPAQAHVLWFVALLGFPVGRPRAGLASGEDQGVGVGAACLARRYAFYQLARMLFRLGRCLLASLRLLLARTSRGELFGDDFGEGLDIVVLGMEAEGEGCFCDIGVFGRQARVELYPLAGGWV